MPEAIDFAAVDSRYMEMPGGRKFYIDDPVFDINEIAYTLAGQPRFNGTGTRNQHDHQISVGEHSVRVSYMLAAEFNGTSDFVDQRTAAMTGLMHDATEAFLGDVPGPWKILLPDFCKLEAFLWEKLCDWIAEELAIYMPKEMPPQLKQADWRGLFLEAREVMTTQGRDWVMSDPQVMPGLDALPLHWWSPADAEAQFLRRFWEIADYGRA